MALKHDSFLAELEWRGFLDAVTNDDLGAYLAEGRRTLYVGFDPTADSLHLGSLIPVMALAHAQRHGHRPLVLIGGGTGLIGDPSGKTAERNLLTVEKTYENAEAIGRQLAPFFDISTPDKGLLLNNAEWLTSLNYITFLRDIGKHFSINEMVKRDAVRMRLEERDHGISYTEFSYMLLQAYDFLHLCQHYDCTIQMGGSDQWGNILSGKELIRRVLGQRGEGITFPLLTTAQGKKFGKSEEGAIYLDARRTSPYQMYQYWLRTADEDVIRYLKLFTFLSRAEIDSEAEKCSQSPELREAQQTLAFECTKLVHGEYRAVAARDVSRILFGSQEIAATPETVSLLAQEMPTSDITAAEIGDGLSLIDVLIRTGMAESRGAARRLITNGGVYLNNRRADSTFIVTSDVFTWGRALFIRSGKKNHHLLRINN